MGEMEIVKVFARLPSYNPFVGTFHHAPSAGNRGAAYFAHDIVGVAELEERKKFRNNPLTGTFHALPGYYDPLHGLRHLRQSEPIFEPYSEGGDSGDDDVISCENNQDDANSPVKTQPEKEFVSMDLDVETSDPIIPSSLPLNLSRSYRRRRDQTRLTDDVLHPHRQQHKSKTRVRCYSDSDAYTHTPFKRTYTDDMHTVESPMKKPNVGVVDEFMPDFTLDRERSSTVSGRLSGSNDSFFSSNAGDDDDDAADSDDGDSDSTGHRLSLAESESSKNQVLMELLEPIVKPAPVTEIVDGYVSTGKGIYRKCGFRSASRNSDASKHASAAAAAAAMTTQASILAPVFRRQRSCPHKPEVDDVQEDEYVQGAPKLPSNPFVARRLLDDEENKLRLMSINRSIPRMPQDVIIPEKSPKGHTKATDYFINPFFIHELAVTEHYELVGEDQLGDGAYAVVKPAIRRSNGNEVAIKQIHKRFLVTEKAKAAVKTEVEIHLRLQHRNIVRLLEVYETDSFLYLVMEKARHGTLKQLLMRERRFPEALAAKLAHQIVRGIFFMHECGIVHCDVKPENVLLTDSNEDAPVESNNVKAWDLQVELCDFGLSVKVPDVRFYKHTGDVHKVPFNGLTGSVGYMAPELFQSQPYGKPVDLWSVGIILYEMLTGYQPFYPPSICVDEPAEFTPRVWNKFSAEARDLVSHLLERDPTKRFTAEQALTHPWFDSAVFGQ
ncbi:Aste57867_18155 [Aphanomyces stellatus]|uniref:Aste57867_18155 protein n=1 Tax=Aphanomyces stellatus TaxID=120398 RepID=A0A485L9B2_9STRA|nr:hypothetical protein As57867_018093 [Aphanomyces stellatus]VFT94893.1 Aste57867_18155 [Aphanomyces stellatus]